MTYLLTWRGTVVCRHRQTGALVQRPLTSQFEDAELVPLGLPTEHLYGGFAQYLSGALPPPLANPQGVLENFQVSRAGDQRTLHFAREGAFLTAEPHGDRITLFTTAASTWEAFLPIEPADFDTLRQILGAAWLIRSSGVLVGQPSMGPGFILLFGDLVVDLRYQIPFDLSEWPHRLTVLRDGWRIDQVCRYRPLVYYSAFGDAAVMEQFAVSLHSLIAFGRYDGQIAVLTDHSPEDLRHLLPAEDFARLIIIRCDARDRVGFMAARYIIIDWHDAFQCQPVLYVDSDIVFDVDVASMLHVIAMSDYISAPLEPQAALATSPSVGATLLQRDFCSPRFAHGFNSGTLGIPNLTAHASTIRLIRQIIANHALLHGRAALDYVDQEIANYVSYRIAHFDTGLITRFVRHGGVAVDPTRRCGLVHFNWVPGAQQRVRAMYTYMEQLASLT